MNVPDRFQLINGDNRLVPIPMWMAKEILSIVNQYVEGKSRTSLPCYVFELQDREEDLRGLIQFVEDGYNDGIADVDQQDLRDK